MVNWHCDSRCRVSRGGAGPWDNQMENFSTIKQVHRNCIGFQKGEPQLKGKENWGHTDIEKEATEFFNQNIDEWFHNLVAYYKGPDKICLIKDKWKLVSQT